MAEAERVHRVVEAVARTSYGRLISYLSARSHDVASAEDALADAFAAALRTWPDHGVPSNPEAWLLHAARRRLIDRIRHERTRNEKVDALQQMLAEAEDLTSTSAFPDERLKLLFVCAHPALDARVHTPLMLQVVLGLDAAAIAAAFLTPAATVGQRLSRAKTKIRDTRIAFEVPPPAALPARLFAVLEGMYAAYNHGWDETQGADAKHRGLTEEAIWLARMAALLLPNEPEALGLLALMQYCEARRPARRTPAGEYVPMSAQDTQLWSRPRLDEADRLLRLAAAHGRPGRFQLEAAIQSAHIERVRSRTADWSVIAVLYEGLVRLAPTVGALLGRAAAIAQAHGAEAGLALLSQLPASQMDAHQPYWALRAHLLHELRRGAEASAAFTKAIELTEDQAVRSFLEQQRAAES